MARSKSPFGAALGCGCAALGVVVVLVFAGGICAFVFSMMKNSEPYNHALRQVRNSPQAVAALGEPIEPGWFLTGSISLSGSSGNADILIPVSGPKAKGKVHVVAEKSGSEWRYATLRLTSAALAQPLDLFPEDQTLEEQVIGHPELPESP